MTNKEIDDYFDRLESLSQPASRSRKEQPKPYLKYVGKLRTSLVFIGMIALNISCALFYGEIISLTHFFIVALVSIGVVLGIGEYEKSL